MLYYVFNNLIYMYNYDRVPEIKIKNSKGLSKPQIDELQEELRSVASNTVGEVSTIFFVFLKDKIYGLSAVLYHYKDESIMHQA